MKIDESLASYSVNPYQDFPNAMNRNEKKRHVFSMIRESRKTGNNMIPQSMLEAHEKAETSSPMIYDE